MLPPSDLTWDLAEPSLLAWASLDLDAGVAPSPVLLAFRGSEPLSMTRLRPFGPGEALDALIELLALFLPLGADRLALALPGRAWHVDEPDAAFAADGTDLRQQVIVTVLTDGHRRRPARQVVALHFYERDTTTWRWGDRVEPPEPPEGPLGSALVHLIDSRASLGMGVADPDRELVAQLGRTLLLGHEVALAPSAAARLELASRISDVPEP